MGISYKVTHQDQCEQIEPGNYSMHKVGFYFIFFSFIETQVGMIIVSCAHTCHVNVMVYKKKI